MASTHPFGEETTRFFAYLLYERRGIAKGSPDGDWYKAENVLNLAALASGGGAPPTATPLNAVSAVFDSNAYRNLSRQVASAECSVKELRCWEDKREITAYASPTVMMELGSHLWDSSDPHYNQCRAALALLYHHCRTDEGRLRCVADSESLIAHMLYGRFPSAHGDTEKLSKLAKVVAESEGHTLGTDVGRMCRELADFVDASEQTFADDIRDIVQWLKPRHAGFDPFSRDKVKREAALSLVRSPEFLTYLASAHVLKARRLLGVPIEGPDLNGMADAVLKVAGPSIEIYRSIVEKLVSGGWDPTKKKRTNSLWDIQVVLGAGEELVGGLPKVTLVTADKGILQAADQISRRDAVISLSSYLTGLRM